MDFLSKTIMIHGIQAMPMKEIVNMVERSKSKGRSKRNMARTQYSPQIKAKSLMKTTSIRICWGIGNGSSWITWVKFSRIRRRQKSRREERRKTWRRNPTRCWKPLDSWHWSETFFRTAFASADCPAWSTIIRSSIYRKSFHRILRICPCDPKYEQSRVSIW